MCISSYYLSNFSTSVEWKEIYKDKKPLESELPIHGQQMWVYMKLNYVFITIS